MVAEITYNLLDAFDRFKWNPHCELLRKVSVLLRCRCCCIVVVVAVVCVHVLMCARVIDPGRKYSRSILLGPSGSLCSPLVVSRLPFPKRYWPL